MRKLLTITFLFFALSNTFAQEIDTIYYDSNWKGVPVKALAAYMRIIYKAPKGTLYSDVQKDYFITGELQAEGDFPVYIDRYDDSKSKWKGKYTRYYKNGKKEAEGFNNDSSKYEGIQTVFYENGNIKSSANFKNGELHGELTQNFENGKIQGKAQYVEGLLNGEKQLYFENGKQSEVTIFKDNLPQSTIVFYENGSVKAKATFVNEKISGTMFQYYEDGSGCIETEMLDGNPKYEHVTYIDNNGNRTKYDKNLENIIADDPAANDLKSTISNGKNYYYYQMNGIFIAVDINAVNEIDKFWEASLVIGNNSNKPFTFETNQIICYLENGDKVESLKVYTSDEFSALVGKKIRRKSYWNAVGENLATMNAGTTTSTTSGYVNSAGVAVDNQGYAAAGISSSYGSASNKTYSGAAQYQANQTARQNVNQYNEQLQQYKQALDQGYLQSNTINPGESITGNVNSGSCRILSGAT